MNDTARRSLAVLAVAAGAAMSPALAPAAGAQDSATAPSGAAAGDRAGPAAGTPERRAPILSAVRVAGEEPRIDGVPDEAAWSAAAVATDFVQFQPREGEPATERTVARVLYGADALFVAFHAYDSSPDSIAGQLTRRDQDSYSDMVAVMVDSYWDRRTAFHFQVNPVGVKTDVYRFEDTGEDANWDAVWDVATAVNSEGWTAEFRIPYSQLRFRNAEEQTWGIQFVREIARRQEISAWAPTARSESAIVSRMGELRGLRDVEPPRRLEIQPYSLVRLERAPGDEANPFYRRNALATTVGADLKYGLTSDLTLDVTINPDFGQVEADPSQVNLSAYETFYPEKRPFFMEGADLFRFGLSLGDGDGADESLFYSRRIGRSPHGRPDVDDGWVDDPERTTILGAWKLSGKTAGGWSVGVLNAVTSEESAEVAPAAGPRYDEVVEPFSNYLVARVARDFSEGRTTVGAITTAVSRDGDVAREMEIRSSAYTAGVDVRHRFARDAWLVQGAVLGSHVRGSEEAILAAQRSPARYFQRPDADHVELDPTRTSLGGSRSTPTWRRSPAARGASPPGSRGAPRASRSTTPATSGTPTTWSAWPTRATTAPRPRAPSGAGA